MPLINLVHDRQAATHRNEQMARRLFFASVGAIAISVVLFGSLSLQAEMLRRDEARLNARLSRLKPLVAQTEANEHAITDMLPKLQTLEDAQKNSDKWARILSQFKRNTPDGTWLTAVRGTADDAKKPISVTVTGKGTDQKLVADLILRAQAMPELTEVNLKFSELRPEATTNNIEFEFSGQLAGSDPSAKAATTTSTTGSGT